MLSTGLDLQTPVLKVWCQTCFAAFQTSYVCRVRMVCRRFLSVFSLTTFGLVRSIGTFAFGGADGTLQEPIGVTIDCAEPALYVTDRAAHMIQVFHPSTGVFKRKGSLGGARDIAFSPDLGYIYVTAIDGKIYGLAGSSLQIQFTYTAPSGQLPGSVDVLYQAVYSLMYSSSATTTRLETHMFLDTQCAVNGFFCLCCCPAYRYSLPNYG